MSARSPYITGAEFLKLCALLKSQGRYIQSVEVKGACYRVRAIAPLPKQLEFPVLAKPVRRSKFVRPGSPRAQYLFAFMRQAVEASQ